LVKNEDEQKCNSLLLTDLVDSDQNVGFVDFMLSSLLLVLIKDIELQSAFSGAMTWKNVSGIQICCPAVRMM